MSRTEAERALIEAAIAVEPNQVVKDNGQFTSVRAFVSARANVIKERLSPELKERAYQAYKARRIADDAWTALDLPREAIAEWWEEFVARYEGPSR